MFHRSKRSSSDLRYSRLAIEMLEPRQLLSANPLISEFMASNSNTLADYYGKHPDWLEIYNPDTAALDLSGWQLKDNNTTWSFPADVSIASHGYLVVFCDSKNTVAPNGELHTNFKLGASGDYLALLKPDNTVVSEYAPEYPQQIADVSYGVSTSLVGAGATANVFIPTDDSLGTTWQGATANEPFYDNDWSSGTIGAGYGTTTPVGSANLKLRLNSESSTTLAADTSGVSGHIVTNVGSSVSYVASSTDTATSPMLRRGLMQFNAAENDQMTVDPSSDLYSATAGTISFWMNSSGTTGTGDGAVLFDMRSSRGMLITQTDAGQIRVRCYYNGSAVNDILSTAAVSDSKWHLVTVNYTQTSGGACSIYIDGVLGIQGNNSASWSWTTTFPLEIGRCSNTGHTPSLTLKNYNGLLDDLRFYTAQLTAQQISDISNGLDGGITTADVGVNLQGQMQNVNTTAYIRIPFTVTTPSTITSLKLTMRYTDGFVAWINGVQVASVNAPTTLAWNSAATAIHSPERYYTITITVTSGMLLSGKNILAIQGLNNSASDGNFLILPQLDSDVITSGAGVYFVTPTPGAVNSVGKTDLGPYVTDVTNQVTQPTGGASSQPLTITATVNPSLRAISTVQIAYRVMYNSETLATMYDDGTHGDVTAGDHIYTAIISTTSLTAGQMLRWRVIATDTLGALTTGPAFNDPTNSEQYYGTVAIDSVSTQLPEVQFFVQNYVMPTSTGDETTVDTDAGARGALFYNGEFYDNVLIHIKGFTSRYLYKRSHHVAFNSDHKFLWEEGEPRISEAAFNAEYADPSYARQYLSCWLHTVTGTGTTPDFPVRLQMNGDFWQLACFIIPIGSSLLTTMGLDPNGALYKFCGQVSDQPEAFDGSLEKKTRKWEDNSDLTALKAAIGSDKPADERAIAVCDMLDLPEVINYIAVARIAMECDDVWANMTLYRDSDGDGLWRIIPLDMNLSFGAMYAGEYSANSGIHANDDYLKAHPLYGGSEYQVVYNSDFFNFNQIYDVIISNPTTREMLLRRMRTIMDEYLQPPGTPYSNLTIENKLDEYYAKCATEAALDQAKWGWGTAYAADGLGTPTFQQAIQDIKTQYLAVRREHLYVDHSLNTSYPEYANIPPAQQDGLTINFGSYDACPISGNQDQEYLTLVNPNSAAVDISGWKLSGGIDFTFASGTVIPAGGTLYVSPNVVAFRQRATGPAGGQGLFVVGGYNGHLSLWGESLQLLDQFNRVVNTLTTSSNPSLAQQYLRITELMYHPADPTGSTYLNEDFEYVELKNTSTTQTLDLTGVHFTDGIVFNFTGSSVTSLAPGAKVLVVSNLAAFQSRYGTGLNSIIAGQYGVVTSTNLDPKHLSNSGEKVTLADALGETILSFTYNDSWYKQTDGTGNSLVIRNASATDRTLWDQREGWFASHTATGSPGSDETPDYAVDAVVVNELLAHRTDESGGMGDWVEFYNTTGASINIGGWYLSNDGSDLKKYRIPDGTVITAYGYKAFNCRDNFGSTANAGCITPFTLGEMGGTVYLTSAASGVLTSFQISQDFSSSDTGVTLGRYIKSTGGKDFVAMATPTYQAPNSQPLVGPVVINEIYYHPDTGGDAFIELKNITSQEVKLYDPALPKNTWHLTEGVDYIFPVGATIPANGYALIVECNPTYFRTKYNIPSSVPIYGSYIHTLDKSGDTIELKYPDDPQPDGDVPYDRMDQITYGDSGLWPTLADGAGASLNRISATAYGNDAANWTAGYPTPGANYAAFNLNPITLVTPAGASPGTITGTTTSLSVVANDIQGEANVIYDWSVTAMPIGATYPTFSVNDTNAGKNTIATFYKAGNYTMTVTLADVYGGVITSSVNVTVVQTQTSVSIVPASVTLLPGASQQFTAAYLDQFGKAIGSLSSSVTWSATAGTITASGFYTAPASGTATITATSGSTNLTASVQVINPVAYWKLDGNGNDSSGNNNTLTLVNSPTYATGQVGTCLSFNGTTQYANSTGSLVNTSQPFSVSAWVNWNGDGGWNTMISEDGTNNSTFFFQKRSGGSFSLTGDNGTGSEAIAMWSTTPTANTWYHLVGVYTGSLLKLYVNGVLVASTSFSIVGAPTGSVIVGAAKYGGGRVDYFHGMIDEVKLFNVALSDAIVGAMYNSPPTDIALSAAVVAENQPSGTAVGTFTTTDPDAGDTFTYTLVAGDGSSDNA
ncbi:MAG: lamin tail domain-containing protein, partial [Thermoguttaceae bacterium]